MPEYSKEADCRLIELAPVACNYIKQEVLGFYDEWLLDTSRQEKFTTHEKTFMYELLSFDYNWRPMLTTESKAINKLGSDSSGELAAIYSLLEQYVDGRVVHSEIISMNPKSRIRAHRDIGDALYILRRFHVPLKTNDQTFFIESSMLRVRGSWRTLRWSRPSLTDKLF